MDLYPLDPHTSMQENGVDVRRLPAKNVYAYGLALLDVMFTKDELARSLIYPSPKSSKPGLPADRVDRFFRELCVWKWVGI